MPSRSVGDRGRWLRLGVAAGLTALLVPVAGLVVPLISSDPTIVAQAGATPKPGSPGGNHSKPGDNKKKKKKSDNKKSNNNRQSNGANARESSEGDRAPHRSGSSFFERTNANNRWSADGPNRSVNNRISSQAEPSQPAQTPSQVINDNPSQGRQNSPQSGPVQDTAPATPMPQTATLPAAQQNPRVVLPAQGEYAPGEQTTTTVTPAAPNDPTGPATALVVGLAAAGAGAVSRRNGSTTRTTSSEPSQGVRGGFSVTHIGQADGDQTLVTLTDPDSPTRYDFDATNLTPEGGSLRVNPDRTVSVLNAAGAETGDGFSAPWARDATGVAQPTQFTAQGTMLTQTISPRADAVYPITADPDEMEVALDGAGGSTGVRVTPENLAAALTSPPPAPTPAGSAAAPTFTPSPQDVAVLRQVMANDGVPASQVDQRVNQVVAGAAQLNTQIANDTLPQASAVPTTPTPEPGLAEGFRDTWDAGIQGIQPLFGAAGPGAPGVFESWGNLAQGLAMQAANPLAPLSSTVDQVTNIIDAPNAAYLAGQVGAQLSQQVPMAIFSGGEAVAVQGASRAVTLAKAPGISFTSRQLASKFKHAGDFGIAGKFNPQNAQLFQQALNAFVDDPATLHIAGTYRGAPTILNVQPQSGLAVLQQEGGQFISGWKLKADQLANVLMRGSL
ncbi:hypothetical protein H7J86_06345 [Mycobacterium hackensackense]|uniref:colicin D domain-containing protein n=1 Tax=Mycobacterium hackensackense TaxID=228909 RepID=UPI002265ECD0|nr:colicin D domain-containing protein [Mycobacterium hackensackense]MCV7251777.1 hypothetical protein [Mycobacterium hackensackense]